MSAESKHKKLPLILAIVAIVAILGVGTFIGVRYLLMRARLAAGPEITVMQPGANKPLLIKISNPVNVLATSRFSQITALEWYRDGLLAGRIVGDGKELNGHWKWTPQQDGTHHLSFLAYDDQGAMSLVSIDVAVLSGADIDADGVPDALDACPAEAGPAASGGCSLPNDNDQDGLVGVEDACPTEPGSAKGLGCPPGALPDGDADGISDARDRCPDESGLPDWDGCPLSAWTLNHDGDELPDFLDDCPDDYGSRDAGGCPLATGEDSDGDGTPDTADTCPDAPGVPDSGGCPLESDRDSDGTSDESDSCPDEAGVAEGEGCLPEDLANDADMDGVLDLFDACPDLTGSLDNNGCPMPDDSDGDGVLDDEDNCLELAGPLENAGCPYFAFPAFNYSLQFRLLPELLDPCERDPSSCLPEVDEAASGVGGGGESAYENDMDGDGVLDERDRCDDERGDPYWEGCPRPGDRDSDGVPDERDTCPDIAGSAPNGCVNGSEKYHLLLELVSFETNPGWQGVYCYGQTNSYRGYPRIPFWNYMGDEYTFVQPEIVLYEGQYVSLDLVCWGQPDDISAHSQYLGSLHRAFSFEFWDGQIKKAMAMGPGGWFEIWFSIRPVSYYEM